jgi:hypothetical protein
LEPDSGSWAVVRGEAKGKGGGGGGHGAVVGGGVTRIEVEGRSCGRTWSPVRGTKVYFALESECRMTKFIE